MGGSPSHYLDSSPQAEQQVASPTNNRFMYNLASVGYSQQREHMHTVNTLPLNQQTVADQQWRDSMLHQPVRQQHRNVPRNPRNMWNENNTRDATSSWDRTLHHGSTSGNPARPIISNHSERSRYNNTGQSGSANRNSRGVTGIVSSPNVQTQDTQPGMPCLFNQLLSQFYFETYLWIYANVLHHTRGLEIRHRLKRLGELNNQTLEEVTANMLQGYLGAFKHGRSALVNEVEVVLRELAEDGNLSQEQASWLRQLSVELGVHLNPQQMLRSFSAVVKDILTRRLSEHEQQQHSQEGYVHNEILLSDVQPTVYLHSNYPSIFITTIQYISVASIKTGYYSLVIHIY